MTDTYYAKYHVSEQQADALLGPVAATLNELERRVQHYLDRVKLGDENDAETLRRAHAALAVARDEVARLWQESSMQSRHQDTKTPSR